MRRKPAWTDRILYMNGPSCQVTQQSYISYPFLTISDHQPVAGDFTVDVCVPLSSNGIVVTTVLRLISMTLKNIRLTSGKYSTWSAVWTSKPAMRKGIWRLMIHLLTLIKSSEVESLTVQNYLNTLFFSFGKPVERKLVLRNRGNVCTFSWSVSKLTPSVSMLIPFRAHIRRITDT